MFYYYYEINNRTIAAKKNFRQFNSIHTAKVFRGAWREKEFKLVVSEPGFRPNQVSWTNTCLIPISEGDE